MTRLTIDEIILNLSQACDPAEETMMVRTAFLREVRDELTRLAGVEEKLPKTADGVAIVPGMDLWWVSPMHFGDVMRYAGKVFCITYGCEGKATPHIMATIVSTPWAASCFYSTEAAAAAAVKGATK